MKLFRYCDKQIKYVPYTLGFYIKLFGTSTIGVIVISLGMSYIFNTYYLEYKKKRINDELRVVVLNEYNRFDRVAMINYLKDLNIKFPHIVYAQAVLESTDFSSKIFKQNNNCFGMKVATARQTTNKGEQFDHAMFDTWKDCIIDYALYQARYLPNIKTEAQYYEFLQQSYAEDTGYVNKLKTIIKTKNIKQLFEI